MATAPHEQMMLDALAHDIPAELVPVDTPRGGADHNPVCKQRTVVNGKIDSALAERCLIVTAYSACTVRFDS